jgi:hypothetical protein
MNPVNVVFRWWNLWYDADERGDSSYSSYFFQIGMGFCMRLAVEI